MFIYKEGGGGKINQSIKYFSKKIKKKKKKPTIY